MPLQPNQPSQRAPMSVEDKLDNLIEAGWYVLESDFDLLAFASWRLQALDCIGELEKQDHDPAHQFTNFEVDFRNEHPIW